VRIYKQFMLLDLRKVSQILGGCFFWSIFLL